MKTKRMQWTERRFAGSQIRRSAMALTKRDPSKNHVQGIHAELHRRYGARSYSLIRVEQYASVLTFLEEWGDGRAGVRAIIGVQWRALCRPGAGILDP